MNSGRRLCQAAIRDLCTARKSEHLHRSLRNAAYNLGDYVAQPAAMLAVAPFLVHRLGLEQYGLWMLVSAILGGVGIVSTGFGDATLKYVSVYRARKDFAGIEQTIRATLTINMALGSVISGCLYVLAPLLARIIKTAPNLRVPATHAFQISAVVLLCRSIEGVFTSVLRGFECYGPAVKLNIVLRFSIIGSAVLLAAMGRGVAEIVAATLFWSVVVLMLQATAARSVAGAFKILPSLRTEAIKEVFAFGSFSWFQALAGTAFAYTDRFLVGIFLGAGPVAIYVLCLQAAQPIHGMCAAMFNFLLPHLSWCHERAAFRTSGRVFQWAVCANVMIAGALALPLVVGGRIILTVWMGAQFAIQGSAILAILAFAYTLLAVNVVPHYALLAVGDVRYVSGMNVLGGALSLCTAAIIIPYAGLTGAALSRVLYGCVTLVLLLRARRAWLHPIPAYQQVVPLSS